jgi:hypothetical protein
VKAARVADLGVILATTIDHTRFPAGAHAGIGAAEAPDRSWREARTARRFTTSRRPVVRYTDLGALALLAQLPHDAARDNTDVTAVAQIASNTEDLETLDGYCATASVRRTADLLTCTTAASPADSNTSERSWASNSPSPPDCYGPGSPSPYGGYSATRQHAAFLTGDRKSFLRRRSRCP